MEIKNHAGTVILTLPGESLRRANLTGAKLLGAKLTGANLTEADLLRADLTGANLAWADLTGADLTRANLTGANLLGAKLTGANMPRANLTRADLLRADLTGANLAWADLTRANLTGADLTGADLLRADLTGARLFTTELAGANLDKADLTDADLFAAAHIPPLAAARCTIVPEGTLRVWKPLRNGVLAHLEIPANAPRSNATGRKCRCAFADVLAVYASSGAVIASGVSQSNPAFVYQTGERVACNRWEENRWLACAGGIHFYLTREEAAADEN